MTKSSHEAPSQGADKYIVRFPDGMRDRIAEAAKASGRSMNAEIVARLQSTFKPEQLTLELGELLTGIKHQLSDQKELITRLAAGGVKGKK